MHRGQLHVVDEGGTIVATVPACGEGEGVDHPCWRGGRYGVVTHSGLFDTAPHWRGTIMCCEPVDCDPAPWASPRHIPGARRVELTRKFARPDVCHQPWHLDDIHGAFDTEGWAGRGTPRLQGPSAFLYLGTVVEDGSEDLYTENCPELSPDPRTACSNSDWASTVGQPQVFAARGFTFP